MTVKTVKKDKSNSFMISIILKVIIQINIKMGDAAAKSPYLNWQWKKVMAPHQGI